MARRSRSNRRERPGPAGFLVVDKPNGVTSHDMVEAARGWLGIRRVGHLGTLDPQATGVLPLAIRGATKLVPFVQAGEKSYVGTVRLGLTTDTLDGQGKVTDRHDGPLPEEGDVRSALKQFEGEIEQIPPMYSAVKRDGVPLHRLARQGRYVERDPKPVFIRRIEVLRFESPDVEIAVQCGAGTYVRSLAHDLGQALGCGAYLSSLRRLGSAPFEIGEAHTPEACEEAAREQRIEQWLVPPEQALGLAVLKLLPPAVKRIENGGDISPGTLERERAGTRVSALDQTGRLVAILELRADRRLWPLRVLPA
ncbi:MAG: tRNA pseudouridine(55) synthase TruB [Myxococcota bacterium]